MTTSNDKKSVDNRKLKISVVVSTFNRADQLDFALKGLTAQTIDQERFEVIVIDNNSTDQTPSIVKKYSELLPVRYENESRQGLGYVRDTGYRLAKGQYITFLDDDAFPAEDYLENMAHVIDEEAPDCVCGPIYPYYTSPKPNWFKDDYEIRQYGKERVRFPEGQVWSGSNMTWKKTVLDTLGGFNTMLGMKGEQIVGGEDTELFERYWAQGKGKIVYAPSVRVFHWVPVYKMSVCYILKRNVAVGIAWARMHGEVSGIAKALLILRWLSEAFFIIVISPVFFFRHFNIQQWLVDAFSRVAVRWGKITGLAGIELELKSQ